MVCGQWLRDKTIEDGCLSSDGKYFSFTLSYKSSQNDQCTTYLFG